MSCLICNKSSEKSLCDECSNKKRCKDCNTSKSNINFYIYKNGKLYSSCIECFNKKVRCEFCNKELNKRYLRSHVKKQHVPHQHVPHTGGEAARDLLPVQVPTRQLPQVPTRQLLQLRDSYHTHKNNDNNNDNNKDDNTDNRCNRTLIVGPSFCGKTHLLLNKLRLIRLEDPEKQIHIITRSLGQYNGLHKNASHISVEEDPGHQSVQDFRNCCVVFDARLQSEINKSIFTRGRHNLCDVYYLSQSYFDVPKRTIRMNSNIIILFRQSLRDVEHIYRDIAVFDMSYDESKELCRKACKEKYNYLLLNMLEDKNGSKYQVCNESNPNYKIFNPQTEPF